MMRFYKMACLLLVPALFPAPALLAQDEDADAVRADKIAVKASRIITVIDEEIADGVVLIENGTIKDVGKDLDIPFDYWVVDAGDGVLFPGLVEAHTTRGLDRSNEALPVVPFLNVLDAIDPSSLYFEDALRDGILTLLVSQGNSTAVGGMARIVKPIGRTVQEMTVEAEAGLKVSVAPMPGQNRMTQMALLRETFRELEEYLGDLAESKYEKDLKDKDETLKESPEEARKKGAALVKYEDLDFKHKELKRLVDGRIPALVYCAQAMDVPHAVEIAAKNGFLKRTVFVLGNECFKAVDALKAAGRPVVLDSDMVYRELNPLTGEETETFVPLAFYEAGIPFAVTSDPRDVYGARSPLYQAARLVRNGIPRDAALRAVTFTPASMMGQGSRLGAIMPGYDATFLVLTGDPLDNATWIDKAFIEGQLVYEREKDYRLKELLTGKKKKPGEEEEEGEDEKKPEGDEEGEPAEDAGDKAGDADKPAEAGKKTGGKVPGGVK